jgi:hypothetical protein
MEQLDREDLKKALRGQTIHQFDRKNVRELIKEMNNKLQVIEVTYGVKIRMGKFKFDGISFHSKIEGTVMCNHEGVSAEKVRWDSYCIVFGLQKSDFGKKITFPIGSRFASKAGTLNSINIKSKKYPILVKLEDGTIVKCPAISIARLLK